MDFKSHAYMGRLNDLVKEIYRLLDKKHQYIRMGLKYAARNNDSSLLSKKASYATDNPDNRPRPDNLDMKVRRANPGKFDVMFVNKHSGEAQRLTKAKGCFYDEAMNYFNFITDLQTETHNDLGHYEIRNRKVTIKYLSTDSHF
jgi:hypothetical protein